MPPKNRHVDITDSLIALGGVRLESVQAVDGYSTIQSGRLSERKTETRAEAGTFIEVLSDLDKHIMYLERVASQPHLYDNIRNRPLRRIAGAALYDWIGKQVGLTRLEVIGRLELIEKVLKGNEASKD